MLVVYGLLNLNERWIQNLVETSNGVPNNLSPPLLAALAVVVVIPRVKPFSLLEEHLRRFLQRVASIPWEVFRLAESLRSAELSAAEGDAEGTVGGPGAAADAGGGDALDDLEVLDRKTASLLESVRSWRSHRGFSAFMGRSGSVVTALEKEHTELELRLEVQRSTEQKLGRDSEAAEALRKPLVKAFESLECQLLFLIASAVLRCCRTEGQRSAQLEALGFPPLKTPPPLTIGRIVLLGLSVWGLFLLAFLGLDQLTTQRMGQVLLDAARISMNLTVAVGAAYLVWRKWSGEPAPKGLSQRPYHRYLLAGAIAFGAALVVNLAFALLHLATPPSADLDAILARLPYSMLTIGLAFGLGVLLDDRASPRLGGVRLRLLEGGTLGVFLGLLAVPAHLWLGQTFARRELPFEVPLLALVGMAVLIGFTFGSLIPHWCREIREHQGAAPAALPAATSAYQ